jgi:hypothetical protein
VCPATPIGPQGGAHGPTVGIRRWLEGYCEPGTRPTDVCQRPVGWVCYRLEHLLLYPGRGLRLVQDVGRRPDWTRRRAYLPSGRRDVRPVRPKAVAMGLRTWYGGRRSLRRGSECREAATGLGRCAWAGRLEVRRGRRLSPCPGQQGVGRSGGVRSVLTLHGRRTLARRHVKSGFTWASGRVQPRVRP